MKKLEKALKTLDKLAAMYAELEQAKKEGVEGVGIESVLELVNLLGHVYAELTAYKVVEELKTDQTKILN